MTNQSTEFDNNIPMFSEDATEERPHGVELRVLINLLCKMSAMPIRAERVRRKALELVDKMEEKRASG